LAATLQSQSRAGVRDRRSLALNAGLVVGALAAASAYAALAAMSTKLGIVVLLGMFFIPIALWRLPVAICIWCVVVFLSSTTSIGEYTNRIMLFIAICWIGLLLNRKARRSGAIRYNHRLVWAVTLLICWSLISLAWAPAPGAVGTQLKLLLYGGLELLLILGGLTERRHLRWLAWAFIAGAAISVLWGASKGGLSATAYEANEVVDGAGRFQGGVGDPNYLAAVLVPAIMLAGGLAVGSTARQRLALVLLSVICAVGLAATQSRGGLLSACICAGAALVVWRGKRAQILGLIAIAGLAIAIYFMLTPAAFTRILHVGSGTGRLDIWTVALRIVRAHPLFGVGFGQFPQVSIHYVLQPGALEYVNLIVESHIVVHNMYLAMWTEEGLIGLLLLCAVILTALRKVHRASGLLEARGELTSSALARGAFLALVALLTASFFLSDLDMSQLWILIGMCGALAWQAERARALAASGRIRLTEAHR
jgi:putative inorganic carbon (HCO3(-)) transporter